MSYNPYIVIDAHYLAHKAQHVLGGKLTQDGNETGLVYGFLGQVLTLAHTYGSTRFVFTFDGGHNWRSAIYPEYKAGRRKERTPDEEAETREFHRQVRYLSDTVLPELGWRNVYRLPGWEADDVIAFLAKTLDDDVVIVSSDHDLYQCLRPNVALYLSHAPWYYTDSDFRRDHQGIEPFQWAVVKAMAGCNGDGVPGAGGVGEKTAVRFLLNELNPASKAFQRCYDFVDSREYRRNIKLVQLPSPAFPGVGKVSQDALDFRAFLDVCERHGFRSFCEGRQFPRWQALFDGTVFAERQNQPSGVVRYVHRD